MFDLLMFVQVAQVAMKWFVVGLAASFIMLWLTGKLGQVLRFFCGDMDDVELFKFSLLSLTLGIIIGVYWMLRAAKEAIFFELVGSTGSLATVKLFTPFVQAAVLIMYGRVVDFFTHKHRLFWAVCSFYALWFVLAGLVWKLNLPMLDHFLVNWIPGRLLGWLIFLGIETLGGILPGAVFWAFVNSTTKTASAKKGFPLIVFGAQIGNFLGPAFNIAYATVIGNINVLFLGAGLLMLVPLLIEFYMKCIPAYLQESDDLGQGKKSKPGLMEGIRLVFAHPFLMGVSVVSTVYELVNVIIDLQFKTTAAQFYSKAELTTFISLYGTMSAVLSITFALFGASFFIRRFGVSGCLFGYPTILGIIVVGLIFKPALWTYFVAMIAVKAFSYSLNNPVKELLYLPTSKDIKFKAKGIIEGVGGKSLKAMGAGLVKVAGKNLMTGNLVSLGIIGVWGIVAIFVGRTYDKLIKNKEILE